MTPEEVKMAFLKAVVRDKDEDEDVLKEWRRIALTCTAVFKMLETDDHVFFEAFNSRESAWSMIFSHWPALRSKGSTRLPTSGNGSRSPGGRA